MSLPRAIVECTLIFFLFFLVLPLLLGAPLDFFPLVQRADLIELTSPIFLIFGFWRLFLAAGKTTPAPPAALAFVLIAALFSLAIGVHLAGNSIQHLLRDAVGTPHFRLAYFYHKPLSHYLIAVGLVGFTTVILRRSPPETADLPRGLIPVCALIYGFTFFCFCVSGKVAEVGALYSVALLAWYRHRPGRGPVARYFAVSHVCFLAFCAIWGVYWRGMPNFDEVGILT